MEFGFMLLEDVEWESVDYEWLTFGFSLVFVTQKENHYLRR